MPTLNCAEFIKLSLLSVSNQSYKNIETIIVDGNSLDDTRQIIKKIIPKAKIFNTKAKGIWHAINYGAQKASGTLIFHLNADDLIAQNSISQLVNEYLNTKCRALWLPVYKAGHFGQTFARKRAFLGIGEVFPGHSASFLIEKKLLRQFNYYDPSTVFCADNHLFYKILANKIPVRVIKLSRSSFGLFTQGGFSSTNPYLRKIFEEVKFRSQFKLPFSDFFFIFIIFPLKCLNSIMKTLISNI